MAGKKSALIIPFNPVEKIMKSQTALRVSDKAVIAMTEECIKFGKDISKKAWELALHAGRRTITDKDVNLASEYMKK